MASIMTVFLSYEVESDLIHLLLPGQIWSPGDEDNCVFQLVCVYVCFVVVFYIFSCDNRSQFLPLKWHNRKVIARSIGDHIQILRCGKEPKEQKRIFCGRKGRYTVPPCSLRATMNNPGHLMCLWKWMDGAFLRVCYAGLWLQHTGVKFMCL